MFEGYHVYGGAAIYKRFPVRASMATAGVVAVSVTDAVGIAAGTTTSFADAVGITKDTATYSTTQADLDDPASDANIGAYNTVAGLDMGRVVTVSTRDDLVVKALISGGAVAGTALTILNSTAASAGGTVITDADVGTADIVHGIVWCTSGANVGHARVISAFSSAASVTVTVPFPRAIAVGDLFLWAPYNAYGTGAADIDGHGNLQATTNIDQADGAIAVGTGGAVMIQGLELNGTTNSYVLFMLADHINKVITS